MSPRRQSPGPGFEWEGHRAVHSTAPEPGREGRGGKSSPQGSPGGPPGRGLLSPKHPPRTSCVEQEHAGQRSGWPGPAAGSAGLTGGPPSGSCTPGSGSGHGSGEALEQEAGGSCGTSARPLGPRVTRADEGGALGRRRGSPPWTVRACLASRGAGWGAACWRGPRRRGQRAAGARP